MSGKTRVVPLRLQNDTADYIDGKSKEIGLSRSQTVENIIKAYRNIEIVSMWSEIDTDNLCEQLEQMFISGELYVKDGKIIR